MMAASGQLQCGRCGKAVAVPAAEAGSGRSVICPACGAIVQAPVTERPPQPVKRPALRGQRAMPSSAAEAPLEATEDPAAAAVRRAVPRWPVLIAAGGVAALAVVAVVVLLLREDPSRRFWRENGAKITAIKGEAERLVVEGKLEDAHAKYREIELLVGGQRLKDTYAYDLVERAKAA